MMGNVSRAFNINKSIGVDKNLEEILKDANIGGMGGIFGHYTSSDSAIKILNGKNIYAFRSTSMNDARDGIELVSYFQSICEMYIFQRTLNISDYERSKKFQRLSQNYWGRRSVNSFGIKDVNQSRYSDAFLIKLNEICNYLTTGLTISNNDKIKSAVMDVYVVSLLKMEPQYSIHDNYFSENLGLWRAYASDGRGVCLNFSANAFKESLFGFMDSDPLCGIYECIYLKLDEIVDRCIDIIDGLHDWFVQNSEISEEYIEKFIRNLWRLSQVVKNREFREEQECRLVVSGDSFNKIASKNTTVFSGKIRSYVPINFDHRSVHSVMAGPCMGDREYMDLDKYLKYLKFYSGDFYMSEFPNVDFLIKSSIPYVGRG